MAQEPVEVVVIVCCYNSEDDLQACLASVLASEDRGVCRRVVVVDNASTDRSLELVEREFPSVDRVRLEGNLGFGGGNNAGWAYAQKRYPAAHYLVLLNPDTEVRTGWLAQLSGYLQAHPEVAAAQAKLLLMPDGTRINSDGNRCHFLGFGMMSGYGEPGDPTRGHPRPIDFASGAAVMLRADRVREAGLFDPVYFMYLEDADLSLRMRALGHEVHVVPQSVVLHRYEPTAPTRYYYHLERNRWLLLLTYYKWPTLLLLAPALGAMEAGQLLYAAAKGLVSQKGRAWRYFLRPRHIAALAARRRWIQRHRRVTDRALIGGFSGSVHLPGGDPFVLRWLGNPLLAAYWAVARRLIRW